MNRRVRHAQAMRSGQHFEVIMQHLGIHAWSRVLLYKHQCHLGKINFEDLILADLYQDLMVPLAAHLHVDGTDKEPAKRLNANIALFSP
ncbi:hypothetical protein D3C84_938090 [compost metagenome]